VTPAALHAGERAARETRQRLGVDPLSPIDDLLALIEGPCGVPVYIQRFNDSKVAGVLLRSPRDQCLIGVNADHHAVRQRFTLAHEFGHVEMDHPAHVDRFAVLFGNESGHEIEVAANYFAAEFLAPRDALLNCIREISQSIDQDVVAVLAMRFGLSMPSICFRLEAAGAIDTPTKRSLVRSLKTNGGTLAKRHRGERSDDALDRLMAARDYPRLPAGLKSMADRALAADLVDQEEYEELTASNASEDAGWL
jgi:Zn-dependent peptidase ImmA (M78 family)